MIWESSTSFSLENLGNGLLGPVQTLPTNRSASSFVGLDIDLDQDQDLISSGGFGPVTLSRSDGSGGYEIASTPQLSTSISEYAQLADFDGDGIEDLVWAVRNAQQFHFAKGSGTGTFGPTQLVSDANGSPRHVRHADLDGDGDLDLAFERSSDGIVVVENDGAGNFTETAFFPTAPGLVVWGIALADLDLNGHVDIAVAQASNPQILGFVQIYGNDGGSFQAWPPIQTARTQGIGGFNRH